MADDAGGAINKDDYLLLIEAAAAGECAAIAEMLASTDPAVVAQGRLADRDFRSRFDDSDERDRTDRALLSAARGTPLPGSNNVYEWVKRIAERLDPANDAFFASTALDMATCRSAPPMGAERYWSATAHQAWVVQNLDQLFHVAEIALLRAGEREPWDPVENLIISLALRLPKHLPVTHQFSAESSLTVWTLVLCAVDLIVRPLGELGDAMFCRLWRELERYDWADTFAVLVKVDPPQLPDDAETTPAGLVAPLAPAVPGWVERSSRPPPPTPRHVRPAIAAHAPPFCERRRLKRAPVGVR